MCDCPAHHALVDCTGCPCDHGPDRMMQWKTRARELEADRDKLRGLLEIALHLHKHGDLAPGGGETWATWARTTETHLRGQPIRARRRTEQPPPMQIDPGLIDNHEDPRTAARDRAIAEQIIRDQQEPAANPSYAYDCRNENWPPSTAFLQAYSAWLADHGIDSNQTARVEHHDQTDEPFIRVFPRDLYTGVDLQPVVVPIKTSPPKPEDYA